MIKLTTKLEIMMPNGSIGKYGEYFYIEKDTIEEYERVIFEIGDWAHKIYLRNRGIIGKCITTDPAGKKYDSFNFGFSCK